MFNEKMVKLGRNRSVIRDLFEYGNELKKTIGTENVFDFNSRAIRPFPHPKR